MYSFVCEKCGGTFQSKSDPSKWRNRLCNNCRGNQYATNQSPAPIYQAKPVPTAKPTYNGVAPTRVERKEFNLDEYITDMLLVYNTLAIACDEQKLTIPIENLCNWTTSIIIEKNKRGA